MITEQYNIYDLGYDRSMSKVDSFYDELSRVANIVENGVNPVSLYSGDMSGNFDLVDGHLQSSNFITGSTGWQITAEGDVEFNTGTFRGTLEAGSIHIPDQTTADSFHTESDGDSYWGCNVADWASDNNNAKAYILKGGLAKFQNIILSTDVVLSGLQAGSSLAIQYLTAGTITSKAITLAVAAGTGDAKIQAGKTDFGDNTSGFILGIDDSDSDNPKFEIGDATYYLKYDPTNHLRIRGDITASTITGGTFQTSDSGKRIVLAGSDNTLRFYDATAESLNIGTAGGQAISITGNATTSRGVVMSSAVAGVGFKYTNEDDVQCVGLDLAMGAGLGLSNSLPTIRAKMGGTGEILWGDISYTGKGVYITRSVGAGTANLLHLSSTNATAGTMAQISRSGSGIVTAIDIDHSTSSNSVNTGIIMSLSSNQANLCRAFRFNGSEIVAAAVGGNQDKKIRVNVAGTDYYIPLHTA